MCSSDLADVGDVDDPHSRMPDRGPELVLVAQGVMQPVLVALPRRPLAAGDVLARHPPARDFGWLVRLGDVVDHQDVADIALHLGRDVGVAVIHVEAVDADTAGLVMHDLARLFTELVPGSSLKTIPYPDTYPGGEPQRRCPDLTKATQNLGYASSVDLRDGLSR